MRHLRAFAPHQTEREHRLCQNTGAPPESGGLGRRIETTPESSLTPLERTQKKLVNIIKTLADLLRTSPGASTAVADTKKDWEDKLKRFIDAIAGNDGSHASGSLASTSEPLPSAPPLVTAPPATLPLAPPTVVPPGGSAGPTLPPVLGVPPTLPPAPVAPAALSPEAARNALNEMSPRTDAAFQKYQTEAVKDVWSPDARTSLDESVKAIDAEILLITTNKLTDGNPATVQRLALLRDMKKQPENHAALMKARTNFDASLRARTAYDQSVAANEPRAQQLVKLRTLIDTNKAERTFLRGYHASPYSDIQVHHLNFRGVIGSHPANRIDDIDKAIGLYERMASDPDHRVQRKEVGSDRLSRNTEWFRKVNDEPDARFKDNCWRLKSAFRSGGYLPRFGFSEADGKWYEKSGDSSSDSWNVLSSGYAISTGTGVFGRDPGVAATSMGSGLGRLNENQF